jgi:predicted RNA methylase
MSQDLLPFDSLPPQANQTAAETTRQGDPKAAEQCRSAAQQLEKHIDAKHKSADSLLLQPPTRRRLEMSDAIRREAVRLEQIQGTLRRLGGLHEDGTIPAELAALRSRAAVERAIFQGNGKSALHEIYRQVACEETDEQRAKRMEREALLKNIPGFFPTPPDVARSLIEFASIESGHTVLEPSAGTGSLVDALLQEHAGARISYCEVNCYLLDVLRLKYSGKSNVHFIARDFNDLDLTECKTRFDRIIMNPPFERSADMEHVLRAYEFLAADGLVAAIVSEGAFCRQDTKAQVFRDFLRAHRADTITLPTDSFKSSGTRVNCRMLRVRKPR